MIKSKNSIAVVAILIFSGSIVAWFGRARSSLPYEFETEIISRVDTQPPLMLSGTVRAPGQISLYAKSDGTVTRLLAKPGDIVEKDAIIAMLDVTETDLNRYKFLTQLEDEVVKEQDPFAALNTVRRLKKGGFYNRVESDDAQNQILRFARDYLSLRAALDDYQKKTEGKVLRAPFRGVVADLAWHEGDYIVANRQTQAGATLYRYGEKFTVELEVPDDTISKISVGAPVTLWMPLSQSKAIKGRVSQVGTAATLNERARYFIVRAELDYTEEENSTLPKGAPQNENWLKVGMRVMAGVQVAAFEEGIWIPRAAIDLQLPRDTVSQSISYIKNPNQLGSRERSPEEKNGTGRLKDDADLTNQSPISRSLANDVTPINSQKGNVYILTSSNHVVEAVVNLGPQSGEEMLVNAPELLGARVITHYRSRPKSWIQKLLER